MKTQPSRNTAGGFPEGENCSLTYCIETNGTSNYLK